MKGLSVRARLMVWNVLAVAALTVLLGFAVSWRVRTDLVANVDRELRNRAVRQVGFMVPPPGRGPQAGPDEPRVPMMPPGMPDENQGPRGPGRGRGPGNAIPGEFPGPRGPGFMMLAQGPFRPRIFDEKLNSVSQFPDEKPLDPGAVRRALRGGPVLTTVDAEGEKQRIFTMRVGDEGPTRVVQYASPLSETDRAIAGVNQTLFGMLPFALFLAGLGGYYLTERALRPVKSLAAGAEKVSSENIAQRLPVHGSDEFAQLAGTINSMLDRLEAAFRRQAESIQKEKRFTGDASHELRSPLTAIKANTSLALSSPRGAEEYRQTIVEIDKSATRMTELIEDLLILARADAGRISGNAVPLDLREIIAEASSEEPDLALSPDALQVYGSRASIVRLFANLLSNAFRHTPEGGVVAVRSQRLGNRVRIEIADSGEGIAREHLDHLGERFYRVDSARARSAGGVGLGLAICKSIVEAHGSELEFQSELGKGTTVRFTLPSA